MAGAGYKLYSSGDVLTASDVNTYIQEQTVMVFDDATARTTALSGVVAEGMLSYLKDSDVVQYYSGSGWVTVNTDQTPLTTKGDLFTYSTADARLAVGNNGETLVADSSASTGLRWQGNFAAGKNAIINGDFRINQRNWSSNTADATFGFDRFRNDNNGGATFSKETFTAGAAPVAGYEAINYLRCVTTGQSGAGVYTSTQTRLEDVRLFAGQTVTISFWAKAASGTPKIAVEVRQNFGTGGSPSANVHTYFGQATLSTSWARYSLTAAIPSISGKTLGTDNNSYFMPQLWFSAGTDFNARTGSLGIQSNTFDTWGWQVEAGNVATAFQTATGTLAGELAAASRYYYRVDAANAGDTRMNTVTVIANSTTVAYGAYTFPVRMRTSPTFGASAANTWNLGRINAALTAIAQERSSVYGSMVKATVASGLTAGNGDWLEAGNNNTAFIEFSAEL